jgi:hypothetical protein
MFSSRNREGCTTMACAVESSPMVDKGFFAERSDESEVKARIVEKYFDAWGRVMVAVAKKSGRNRKLAYIDLYAGPGRYQDGSASTPLLVLQRAIANPDLCAMLATLFNDMDEDNSHTLANEIAKLPGIERLKHKPVVFNDEVGPEAADTSTRCAWYQRSPSLIRGATNRCRSASSTGSSRIGAATAYFSSTIDGSTLHFPILF